jgi:outer membrane protein assembly factor BamB
MPVYDSGMNAANYLPYGYAVIGVPRGTLTIADDILYARMGPPVTGWLGGIPGRSDGSLSTIVALDLGKQGSLCPGYPVRLWREEFPEGEFEGCPLVLGDQLIVAVAMRDQASLRRIVIALDRETGVVNWRSPVLAAGSVSGSEQASLIAHQLVSAAGGRVFYNTNLGAIVCLDAESGQIVWCTRYQRSLPAADAAYALPDRYRYRDLVPCMIAGTQVICAPQDCPEVFALDGVTGDLLWSTDGEQVDDATQILGVSGQSILLSGDRLYWLERTTGRVVAAFPAGTTSDIVGALPAPRGYGRGMVVQDRVYWPTQHELFVFDADQVGRAVGGVPTLVQRYRLDTRGAEAGNLVLTADGLVIAGASRIYKFRPR